MVVETLKEPTILDSCAKGRSVRFHRNNGENLCRLCQNKSDRDKKYRADNPEKVKAYRVIYSAENAEKYRENARKWFAENKERGIATRQAYRKKKPEYRIAEGKKYREANKERINKDKAQWKKDNPGQILKDNHIRRARKAGVPSEPYTPQQVLELYGTDCHICHEPIDLLAPRSGRKKGWERGLHIDHVVPLSKGGSGLLENVRPSHASCNLKKHTKLINYEPQTSKEIAL